MRRDSIAAIAFLCVTLSASGCATRGPSDERVRLELIRESIAAYPGRCPCPYNTARDGSNCGARSAYARVGGYEPLCYETDVTADMIRRYRASTRCFSAQC